MNVALNVRTSPLTLPVVIVCDLPLVATVTVDQVSEGVVPALQPLAEPMATVDLVSEGNEPALQPLAEPIVSVSIPVTTVL